MTKKNVFISYSDLDRTKMRSLQRLVENTGSLVPIVIADNRQALFQLSDKVKAGITQSDYVIPILTQNSVSTQWINQEIGFATALNKTLIPIVEEDLIPQLKGFIHKGLDLSYSYIPNEESYKSEISKFARVAKVLVNDLLENNGLITLPKTIGEIFPGKWMNNFEKEIEITEDGKYLVRGQHWFNLTDVKIDAQKKKISFTKTGLLARKDNRVMRNELKIVHTGREYVGFEKQNGEKYEMVFHRTS